MNGIMWKQIVTLSVVEMMLSGHLKYINFKKEIIEALYCMYVFIVLSV